MIYLKLNDRGWGDVPAVKTLTDLAEDSHWVPSIHFGQLTTANNSTYRGVSALFWPLWHYIHLHTHPLTHTNKMIKTIFDYLMKIFHILILFL